MANPSFNIYCKYGMLVLKEVFDCYSVLLCIVLVVPHMALFFSSELYYVHYDSICVF